MGVLKNRNFAMLFYGGIVSMIGSVLVRFGVGIYLLDITGKATYLSIYVALNTILLLILQPLMGAIADRLNKVKILAVTDFCFGITDILTGLILVFTDNVTIIITAIMINAVINAFMEAMYNPTSSSMIPLLLDEEDHGKAYSLFSTVGNFQYIIGVLLAGILYNLLGFRNLLLINGATFLFASFMESFIRYDHIPVEVETGFKKLIDEVVEGFRYIKERSELINLAKLSVVMNIFLTGLFTITLPYLVRTDLGQEPIVYSFVTTMMSVGAILMSLYLSTKEKHNAGRNIVVGFFLTAVIYLGIYLSYLMYSNDVYGVTILLVIITLLVFSFGLTGPFIQVPINISYAKRVDKDMLGRVSALRSTLASIASPFSMMVFGLLLDNTSILTTLGIAAIGLMFVATITIFNKPIRGL